MARIGITRDARAHGPRWIEGLARVGFVAKGVLYATVGLLTGWAGWRQAGDTTDTRGALETLSSLPFGSAVLLVIGVGLVGYATWRIVEGIADPDERGSDPKALAVRASLVARGLLHLGLAASAFGIARLLPRFAQSTGGGGNGDEPQQATALAFELPAGQWIVLGVAVGIGGYGLYQVYRGIAAKLNRNVDRGDAEREVGAWVIAVSRVGIAARGLVFAAVAWMLGLAALRHDSSEAGGLDQALQVFRNLGRWPFIAIGAGLVAYAVYQFLSARYRRIRVS